MAGKRRYRRNNGKRSKPLSKAQYRQVAKIANKQIHKMSELKTLDLSLGDTSVRNLATIANPCTKITFPIQGDASNQRDGDSIYLKDFSLRGQADCDADQAIVMRLIVFQWLEDDSVVTPTLAHLLESAVTGPVSLNSHYKRHPEYRFRILDDRNYYWSSNVTNAPKPYIIKVCGNFAIHKPEFTAGATTGKGMIYYAWFSDSATNGTMQAPMVRLNYYDN